jgi:hypothetical protein
MEKPKAEMPRTPQLRLLDALREARVESAERSDVVVDLHDAELARLDLLNDALDGLFAEIPATIDLFDRGLTHGDTPRLWIDMIAHVAMGRDRRVYRFIQDTRHGARLLAETPSIEEMVSAITRYVARRMIERERALAADERRMPRAARLIHRRRFWRDLRNFFLGIVLGIAAVFAAVWFTISRF